MKRNFFKTIMIERPKSGINIQEVKNEERIGGPLDLFSPEAAELFEGSGVKVEKLIESLRLKDGEKEHVINIFLQQGMAGMSVDVYTEASKEIDDYGIPATYTKKHILKLTDEEIVEPQKKVFGKVLVPGEYELSEITEEDAVRVKIAMLENIAAKALAVARGE